MQVVIDFIMAHQVVLCGLFIAVLDLIFALVPTWKSNGILHSVYVFLENMMKPKA